MFRSRIVSSPRTINFVQKKLISTTRTALAANPIVSSEAMAATFKKSNLKTKVKNPMIRLLFLISMISSALISIASSEQELEELKLSTETKKIRLKEILQRVEKGEIFNVEKEIESMTVTDKDRSIDELIEEIQKAEEEWIVTDPQPESSVVITQSRNASTETELKSLTAPALEQSERPTSSKFL